MIAIAPLFLYRRMKQPYPPDLGLEPATSTPTETR
jgi:hypothetical protein